MEDLILKDECRNHLLLVGIDKYSDSEIPNLQSCVKDCIDFRDILFEKFDFIPENTREIFNDLATNYKIQETLKTHINNLNAVHNLVIYFSGHGGGEDATDRGFWVPSNALRSDYTTWIANETILFLLRQIRAKHVVLISDSCFSRKLLLTEPTKTVVSAKNYDADPSRWALTSGADI